MKRESVCLPCVLDDLVGALDLLPLEEEVREEVLGEALVFLRETWPEARIPSFYITGVHRILKRVTGLPVPFAGLREACNRVGAEIAAWVEERTAGMSRSGRFRELCLWAVAGNHLDFRTVGAGYGFGTEEIRGMLEEKVRGGFDVDRVEEIEAILEAAERILYVPDNVGEIALDRLLVLHLREGGARVAVPYRGGAITSDATLDDFRAVGLDRAADAVFPAGPDTLGISFEEMSGELREELRAADAVVAKGQANFYAFHEHRHEIAAPIACLLTTKCAVASRRLGREERVNAAVVLSRGTGA